MKMTILKQLAAVMLAFAIIAPAAHAQDDDPGQTVVTQAEDAADTAGATVDDAADDATAAVQNALSAVQDRLAQLEEESANLRAAAEAEATEDAPPAAEPFVFNTLLFLIGGFLVMFMAAGFAMLEAGLVRSKNASMQCLKNIGLYSIAGLMFWLLGYNLMYENVSTAENIAALAGYLGTFSIKDIPAPTGTDDGTGYAIASDWFFQMVFCATTASIVSGTIAERMRLWPFLIFVVFLTGILYPITGSWQWGGGWLAEAGFSDFAGSTLVHSVGGWAALAGALVIGARAGKFGSDGVIHPMPGSSIPLATLGTFILWLGWFGFNGGSQLALGTISDAQAVAKIFVNTNLAAASGVVVVIILTQIFYRKVDVTMALNGALAGLVSITAEPLAPTTASAAFIGGIGGLIVVIFVPLLDKIRVDDVVGAIPVHLVAGIWGTLIVPLTNDGANYYTQFIGVVSIGALAFFGSLIVWLILAAVVGLRATPEEEALGLDSTEVGVNAYPEFGATTRG
jgi:Amt family ammonium transporter